MAKHFELSITDASFSFHRKTEAIAAEAALDGIYVVRTNLPEERSMTRRPSELQSLARVERAFRCLKTVDMHLRPVFHWMAARVRAHVFLCMLAYYVEWHMRQSLRRCCTTTPTRRPPSARRACGHRRSAREAARRKQTTGLTDDGLPVHSFQSLLADLATLARNTITTAITPHLSAHRADPA